MTACQTNRLVGACLLFLWTAAATQGQTPPTASEPPATQAPQSLTGGNATSPPAPVEFKPGILGDRTETGIVASDLGIVDGPPVGTLDDANGGLGQRMWVGASRSDIEELLGRIPLVSADPFVRALAQRVVLTKSDSPVGPAKRALVTIRIEKLLQAGMIVPAGAIAASLILSSDGDFARVQADALLYAARDKDVCSDLTMTRLTSGDPFWLQLRLWCFASSGDAASAELTRAVLDAQGLTEKALDVLVDDAITGRKTSPGEIAHPTALHIFLLQKSGLPVTAAVASTLGTSAHVLAARDVRNSPSDRLVAATAISKTSALTASQIVAIMDAQEIAADQLAHLNDTVATLPFLPAQSLLRRAAKHETRPTEKAQLLAAALWAQGHADRLPFTALLEGDVAANIAADASLDAEKSVIARALVLSGRSDAAQAWYNGAAADDDARLFEVLLDLSASNANRSLSAQTALKTFAAGSTPPQTPTVAAVLALGISDVLDRPMPQGAKSLAKTLEGTQWGDPKRRPSSNDMRKLEIAASDPERRGEAVLRILDIVGADGPFGLPPDVTIECVCVLNQIGLGDEARMLAIEALALQPAQP